MSKNMQPKVIQEPSTQKKINKYSTLIKQEKNKVLRLNIK